MFIEEVTVKLNIYKIELIKVSNLFKILFDFFQPISNPCRAVDTYRVLFNNLFLSFSLDFSILSARKFFLKKQILQIPYHVLKKKTVDLTYSW